MFEDFLKFVVGGIANAVKNSNDFKAISIPAVENNGKFDYYFINKQSSCFALNSMGMSIELKLINNSDKKIIAYICDSANNTVFTVVGQDEKFIVINKYCSKKIHIDNIDYAEQCFIMFSKDNGINYNQIPIV